jgi:archaellum component FlaC
MQERRLIIRIPRRCRMQYCSSDDLLPRDGRLLNVSDRGAGLLVREPHRQGEMVSIGFALPEEPEALTATGVVRWSATPPHGHWHAIGLDWLQLDDTTRNRLQRFMSGAAPSAATPPPARRTIVFWVAAAGTSLLLIGVLVAAWLRSLQWENQQLQAIISQRDAVIAQLAQEESRLKLELGEAKTHLAQTTDEVARLDQQAQGLGEQIQALTAEISRIQNSYLQVRAERAQLIQQVLDLEQERAALRRRLSSVEELKVAIQEAIDMRKAARQAERLAILEARREAQEAALANGNRGYLIRDGRPTLGHTTVWIRVHDPQEQ